MLRGAGGPGFLVLMRGDVSARGREPWRTCLVGDIPDGNGKGEAVKRGGVGAAVWKGREDTEWCDWQCSRQRIVSKITAARLVDPPSPLDKFPSDSYPLPTDFTPTPLPLFGIFQHSSLPRVLNIQSTSMHITCYKRHILLL